MRKLETKRVFNNDGTVTISLSLTFSNAEFVTDKLPESCSRCPVGYGANGLGPAGTNIPCGRRGKLLSDRRDPNCKLKTILDYLKEHPEVIEVWPS